MKTRPSRRARGAFGTRARSGRRLPCFFCSAEAAPGLIETRSRCAKSASLDHPLPSLFRERLFVHGDSGEWRVKRQRRTTLKSIESMAFEIVIDEANPAQTTRMRTIRRASEY
jgi:hypothetical protein